MMDALKPRILLIAQNLPYPTFSGMDLRNWQNVNGLLRVGEVGVFGLCSNDTHRVKSPDARLAFWRCTADPDLSYPTPVGRRIEARAWVLDRLGHPADIFYSDMAAREVGELMREFEPQIVVVEGLFVHRYVDLIRHFRCRIILDCHNVEAPLWKAIGESMNTQGFPARMTREILPKRVDLIERSAVQKADQIWACSGDDVSSLQEFYSPRANICLIPNSIDVRNFERVRSKTVPWPEGLGQSTRVLLYPAAFFHKPNIPAAVFLMEEVYPRLADHYPDCQLWLVGSRPTPDMIGAARMEPRIVVTGAVADIKPYFGAASVMVVPLFQGGGTRLKILEAFAAGIPVVATAKAVEGIEVKDGEHYVVAERAEEFVEAIENLWSDSDLKARLVANGLDLVERRYSWEESSRRIRLAIEELINKNDEINLLRRVTGC
jgi:glycosyltransferase involved in cell wall biosynthesis